MRYRSGIPTVIDDVKGGRNMLRVSILKAMLVLGLAAACAFGQAVPEFKTTGLVKLGDAVSYGSYKIIKIGDGIYQLMDPGDPKAKAGGLVGVDMYVICGTAKALMIDLGNNYIDGYAGDEIPPRKNAAPELLAVVNGLIGKLPLEIAITHAHPDHDGMTGAFLNGKTVIWMPQGEDLSRPQKEHKIDPAAYTVFDQQTKTFDLGGGRVVKPLLVRGHSNGGTAYLLAKDMMLFTGDCIGLGAGRSIGTAAALKIFAEDTQKLVDYMKNSFSPYERYALKVYVGHSKGNSVAGFRSPNHGPVDIDYLDWRFVQDMASCTNAIVKGQWLVADSGLRLMEMKDPRTGRTSANMLYGIGAVQIPIEAAYEAAGLKMPQ
jgi:glyoxylase-like metal-dependent hydrolase (beta-lactamase superfamily II)